MSKRLRFVIVLALFGVAVAFLMPTIRWYWFITAEQKLLATGSRFEIREWALRHAADKIKEIKGLIAKDPATPIPGDLLFLTRKIKERYRVDRKSVV